MIWFLMIAVSWAEGHSLVRPPHPIPASGECPQSISLRIGEPVSVDLVSNGVVVCSAVAEPTSSLAHLLAIETYCDATEDLNRIEFDRLNAEVAAFQSPKPWIERRSTQRWLGRIETALIVGIIAGGYVAISTRPQ